MYPRELIDWLADISPAHDAAWDAGCGSGQLAVPLAQSFRSVIATDASADQIAHATPHDGVEYRVAPAERSGLADRAVDLAVAAQAAHWFDLPAFYEEVRRVLKPRGALALITYNMVEVNAEIDRIVGDFYHSLRWPPERRLVEEGYATIDFPFEEIRAPQFYMRNDWTPADLLGYVTTWSALRDTDTTQFERRLRDAWGDTVRAVRWPIAMRAGRVG